jgi:hypothetical protein
MRNSDMAFLPDAGIETIEDKLKTVLKLRSATVSDIPVLMHMARALAEQQGLTPLMTATAAGWRRDLGKAFDATVAATCYSPDITRYCRRGDRIAPDSAAAQNVRL